MKAKIALTIICSVLIMTATCFAYDKANRYSVSATVYGYDNDVTLFETPDGNVWAYNLPFHVEKGKEVRLNMYDRSPDGRTVTDNIILSVEIDGREIK